MGTFSTQTQTCQIQLAQALQDVSMLCLETDERYFGNVTKTVRGNDAGSPYVVTYTPHSDISGDYTCDVTYGLTAGLDPNRALIFLLQAKTAGGISLDTFMRSLPVAIEVEREKRLIDLELIEGALGQAIAGYAQAIPMLATQGQDPAQVITAVNMVLQLVGKGKSMGDAVAAAFPPPPPPQAAVDPVTGQPAPGGAPGAPGGDPNAAFNQQTGLPQGVARGQAGMGAGGAQEMLRSVAGMSGSGRPQMGSVVSSRTPV